MLRGRLLLLVACVAAPSAAPTAAPSTTQESRADAAPRWIDVARANGFELPADVDFERDPICRAAGLAVARGDFARWLALGRGAALVEAEWLRLAGAHAAREPRDWLGAPEAPFTPVELTDARAEAALDAWCKSKGLERAAGEAAIAQSLRLPRAAALLARRAALQAVIDFFGGRGASSDPPPSTRALLVRAGRWQEARPLLALLEKWRAAPDSPEGAAALAAASEPLALYLVALRREEKLRTTATFLDHELEGGAVAVHAPLDAHDESRPPWARDGASYVATAPIEAALRAALSPDELRAQLRAYLALRAVAAAHPRTDAAAEWRAAVEVEVAGQQALLSDEAVALLYDGFPNGSVWRAWRQASERETLARWPGGDPVALAREFAAQAPWASASAARALELCAFDGEAAARAALDAWSAGGALPAGARAFEETRYARLVHGASAVWRAHAAFES
ncbi:MAG: hypothetical protein EPO68_06470, partial [Planctomycetota bacterium]